MKFRSIATRLIAMAAVLAVMVGFASLADACPGCKENLPAGQSADGQATANVAQGFAWSIYLMLGVMITLLGSMGGAAFFLLRKAARRGQL